MDINDILRSAQGRRALDALAQSNGLTHAQIDAVLGTVVPALSSRIERNTLSRGGVADLLAELGRPEHARALADPAHVATPEATAAGIGALDTIFGDKAKSRSVAAQAAMSTGLSQILIQKLLPIIASLVMAALSKGSAGGLGDILKKLPDLAGAGNDGSAPQRRRRQADPTPQDDQSQDQEQDREQDQTPNQGGPAPGIPGQGDIGDILRKLGLPGGPMDSGPTPAPAPHPASFPVPHQRQSYPAPAPTGDGSFGGGSPLPIPGDRIPGINAPANDYGNLPDVVRRGGQSVDGNPLGTSIRDILGSVLGFQSKGFIGWAIRLLVLRWGWGFLRRIVMGR